MSCLQASAVLLSTITSPFSPPKHRILSVNRPTAYLKKPMAVAREMSNLDGNNNVVIENLNEVKKTITKDHHDEITLKVYAILEAISDRIETHNNVKEQREYWNALLLNSINMIILTASTMVGISATSEGNLALKVSSMVLFLGATGLLTLITNKIQPSQLAEEQRNAVRLFKQLESEIQMAISLGEKSRKYVKEYFERVLALDRAYPLPLLNGAMLERYPDTFKPAVWWPSSQPLRRNSSVGKSMSFGDNGWSGELEEEMRDIMEVIEKKDIKEYDKLGKNALKLNKALAIMGPILTGIAALGSVSPGSVGQWGAVVAAMAGSLACVVNTVQHGGQVGMVFEMYRNCGGFFKLLVEEIESNIQEGDFGNRENGELFEMKMGLKLGRSLSALRKLAEKSRLSGGFVDEFASKLI